MVTKKSKLRRVLDWITNVMFDLVYWSVPVLVGWVSAYIGYQLLTNLCR